MVDEVDVNPAVGPPPMISALRMADRQYMVDERLIAPGPPSRMIVATIVRALPLWYEVTFKEPHTGVRHVVNSAHVYVVEVSKVL